MFKYRLVDHAVPTDLDVLLAANAAKSPREQLTLIRMCSRS